MISFSKINSELSTKLFDVLALCHVEYKDMGPEIEMKNHLRGDKTFGSFKLNKQNFSWCDFATGDKGGDLISLYAYFTRQTNGKAAAELTRSLGLNTGTSTPTASVDPDHRPLWMDILWPCPADAPPPPDVRPVKTDHGWARYQICFKWPYRDQLGNLLGYVVRYETPTGKETPPITLWKNADGVLKWRFKSFPTPRPLFNLDKLAHAPGATIIIVEGEKCAEVLQGIIEAAGAQAKLVVMTWPGGAKSIGKADFSPLRGRQCVLWPDFDLQKYPNNHTTHPGEVMPFGEQPGMVAMYSIAGILRGLDPAIKIKIVQQQPDKPAGWDVADAILTDGWDLQACIQFIKQFAVEPTDVKPIKTQKQTAAPEQPPVQPPSTDEPIEHFKVLGFRGKSLFFLPKGSSQITDLKPSDLAAKNLISLAPLSYWERAFSSPRGPNWLSAADTIIRMSNRAGLYNPHNIRGRGAWFDEGRLVIHCGNRLIVDGKEHAIGDFKSKFVYEIRDALDLSLGAPLNNDDANNLLAIIKTLHFERTLSAYFFAGWIVTGPFAGCFSWRTSCWMTGDHGTGKSWIIENIIKPCLGGFQLAVQGGSSEAGIRQKLGRDAIAVILDEGESENEADAKRIQSILHLMRQSSSDSDSTIIKGGQDGNSHQFSTKSTFLFSSINVGASQKADLSRLQVLTLLNPPVSDAERIKRFRELCKTVERVMTPAWCTGLRARTVDLLPVIIHNTKVFSNAAADLLGRQRYGDQVGGLLAGAYSLASSNKINHETALAWLKEQDLSEEHEEAKTSEPHQCLRVLMQHICRVNIGLERSVQELLIIVRGGTVVDLSEEVDTTITPEEADRFLRRIGFRYFRKDDGSESIAISCSSEEVTKIMEKERPAWAAGFIRILQRYPGIERKSTVRFQRGVEQTRAILVPWGSHFHD